MTRILQELRRAAPAVRGGLEALRDPHVVGQLGVRRDIVGFVRLHFLAVAAHSGLLEGLPAARGELSEKLGFVNDDLVDGLIRLGVALDELGEEDGRIVISGRRSLALVDEGADALVAMLDEFTDYHTSVYRELPARMRGAELGDYLERTAATVANSSRVVEPFVAAFVRSALGRSQPRRLLEIGCGSGVYLRVAAEAYPELRAIGIDLNAEVVALAAKNIAEAGLDDRVAVIEADVRTLPEELRGPYDVVTLYNNVYYFPVDDRPGLFADLRAMLRPGGLLALVSMMQGDSPLAADLDLTLRSTIGAYALPRLAHLEAQLREAGFSGVEDSKLLTSDPLYGVVAT
jgi:predicted O-methyltransferase YrrM